MRFETWRLELLRRLRRLRGASEIAWPDTPPGVFLNPSDADFAAYATAPLALTWHAAPGRDPVQWQTQARTKLRELLGISPLTGSLPVVDGAGVRDANNLRRRTVYLESAPRRHVPVTIVWDPKRVGEPLPVMICLQGHTSGAHISWGEARAPIDADRIANGGDFAVQAVRHGHVAVCIEQIAFGERREQAITHRWDHSCIDASNRALLLGRTLLGDRVSDVLTIAAWLRNGATIEPRIDGTKIRTMGNSAGGETALFTAALDPSIEAVIASGCVGAWRKTSGTRQNCPDTVIPGILAWMEYSDIVALCAPRPTLVVSGISDHLYPYRRAAECAEEARPVFSALSAAGALQTASGQGGHRFYPDQAWPAFNRMLGAP